MILILKNNWTKEQKRERIDNFINQIAEDLFMEYSSYYIMENSGEVMNECLLYSNALIEKYLKNFEYGFVEVNITRKDILKIHENIQSSISIL